VRFGNQLTAGHATNWGGAIRLASSIVGTGGGVRPGRHRTPLSLARSSRQKYSYCLAEDREGPRLGWHLLFQSCGGIAQRALPCVQPVMAALRAGGAL